LVGERGGMSEALQEFIGRCRIAIKHSLLVFIDGQWSDAFSKLDEQLAQMMDKNLILATSGLQLHIDNNTVITNPVHLLFLSTKSQENKINNVIEIGESSKVTVIEEFAGFPDIIYSNHESVSFTLKKDAALDFYKIQNENILSKHFVDVNIHQLTASKVGTVHLGLGSKNSCENLNLFLEGEQASCILHGLYVPKEEQKIEYHLKVEHKAANCASRELFKGVVNGCAHAVFDGKVIIHPGAIKSFAKLNNRNLLLTDEAQVTAKPALEIYVDDVQCTHGATVGQIDEAALWYLRSRGIPEAEARQMLIDGFKQEIMANLPEFLYQRVK
jgi:Fe-S cluster assembly protein SufD